ncbi:MAG: ROK family transcriptional regulator [Planctomycetota bacterium]
MLNKAILLYIHEKSPVTRTELSARFDLAPALISRNIKDLFTAGLIVEDGFTESTGGRRSALLRLNPAYAQALALKISRRGIRLVRFAFDGSPLVEQNCYESSFAATATVQQGLETIMACIEAGLKEGGPVKGIGIAISGIVDRATGVSHSFPDFSAWRDVPLKAEVERRFGVFTAVESLIHASVRGEHRYGIGRNHRNLIYVHLGMGIACGAVFDGRVYYGSTPHTGELGHTSAVPEGPQCYCGKHGCLESVASPVQIERAVREAAVGGVATSVASAAGGITLASILNAAAEGDRVCRNAVEKAGEFIGRAASNLANVFAPDAVVVGGAHIAEESLLFRVIADAFRANVTDTCPGVIVPGMLKDRAALYGAGDRAFAPLFG